MVTVDGNWVDFVFYRPEAKRVCVAGVFNGWRTGEIEMLPAGDGNWKVRVPLPSGEFRFRYCADGEWFTDYAACGVAPGRFGMDSIVIVPMEMLETAEAASRKDSKGVFAA